MSTPAPRPHRPALTRRRRRMYLLIAAAVVLGLASVLVLRAFEDSLVFFYSPTDIATRSDIDRSRMIRIGGMVEKNSLRRQGTKVDFSVTDGPNHLTVTYTGVLPDLFREGQGVVAQGRIGADGIFNAREVLAKHDENYMPREVADALKESGYWQHEKGGATPPAYGPKP
jgi:cytochrome c-type biogenesis protein CcmE